MEQKLSQVIKAIEEAFDDVPFPRTTVHEAELVDDTTFRNVTDVEIEKAIQMDKVSHWNEVQFEHLEECEAALSHIEEDGFKFYIPAFMILGLKKLVVEDEGSTTLDQVVFHLTHLDVYTSSKICQLNDPQKKSVCIFLRYLNNLENVDYYTDIPKSLESYWDKFCE